MTYSSAAPSSGPGQMGRATTSSAERAGAPVWEQIPLVIWFIATFTAFPRNELILYPLALYFTASIVLRRNEILPIILRSWILFTLPALTMLSLVWAPSAVPPIRLGLMMSFTALVTVYAAARFTPRQIVQIVFFATLALLLFIARDGNLYRDAPFDEKNFFAIRMVVTLLAAMAIAFDNGQPPWLRLIAFPIIPLPMIAIDLAESATSLIFGLLSIALMTTVWLMWSNIGRVQHLRSLTMLFVAAAGLVGALFFFNTPYNTLYEDFLASLNKDTTLTGRTILWDAAERIIQERPLLGVGAGGFWQWHVGEAQTLVELFYKPPGTAFSFHSSYLEVQVHLGLLGLVAIIGIVTWIMLRNLFAWLVFQDIPSTFFLIIAGIVLVSSFTESWFFGAFDTNIMIVYIGAISAMIRSGASLSDTSDAKGAAVQPDPVAEADG